MISTALNEYAENFENENKFRSLSMTPMMTEPQSLRNILVNRLWGYYYTHDATVTYENNALESNAYIDNGTNWADLSAVKYMPVCRFSSSSSGVTCTWAVWSTTNLKSYVEPYFSTYQKCVDAIQNVIEPFMVEFPQFADYVAVQ